MLENEFVIYLYWDNTEEIKLIHELYKKHSTNSENIKNKILILLSHESPKKPKKI